MRRLVPWALLVASLAANLAMGLTLTRRGGSPLPSEPLIFSKVALDQEQRARILALRSELVAQREEAQRSLTELRSQLAAAISRAPQDGGAVDSALHRIADSQARFQEAVVKHLLAVRSVLTPEQRPAFEEIVARHIQTGGHDPCGLEPSSPHTSP